MSENRTSNKWERRIALAMAGFILVLVAFVVFRNEPFADENIVAILRIVVSIAAGILGATIPGFLNIEWQGGGFILRAGGALALVIITYSTTPDVFPPPVGTSPTPSPSPPPPPTIVYQPYQETVILGENEASAVRGIPIRVGWIYSEQGVMAKIDAGNEYQYGGRFRQGEKFSILAQGCESFNIIVSNIILQPKDPNLTMDQIKNSGLPPTVQESMVERKVTLIATGSCQQ